jgi:outer membrane protein TolC
MKRNRFLVSLLAGLVLAAAAAAQTEAPAGPLGLEESILRALRNNLAVQVQVLNPELAIENLSRAKEKFVPSLSMTYNKQDTESASYSWIDASGSVVTRTGTYNFGMSESLPFGGTMNIRLDNSLNDSNQKFQTINPRYSSTLRFSFSQPLLRNFGYDLSRREILIAHTNLDISEIQFERTLANTVFDVEEAYWNLAYSIDNLEVRRQALKLAQDLLEKNQRSVEVGTLAPMEILSAKAEVATREADIIQAEAGVRNAEDRLRTILNLPASEAPLLLKDKPTFAERKIGADEALAIALQMRPELRASRLSLKNENLNVSYARNQILPELNLSASYWSPGVSGDQIVYLNNDPLTGVVLRIVPGGGSAAFKDATGFKYQNWSLGLTLSLPLGNVLSRALYAQAKLNLQQAMLNVKNDEQQAALEVRTAIRSVDANYKRIQAYRVARELAEQKLAAEEEKLKVGLSTNFLVLSYQRDLSNARSAELQSIVSYNVSLASLDRALGTSLQAKNIRISDYRLTD